MNFCYFVVITPWKRRDPSYEETRIPFTQGDFVSISVEYGPVVLEKKIFKFRQRIFTIS